MTKSNLNKLKTKLIDRVTRKLGLNNPNTNYDEDVIGDYIEEAVGIIEDWARPASDSVIVNGAYNTPIVLYVVESINLNGAEGFSSYSDNSQRTVVKNSPVGNLKSRIPQGW